MRQLNLPTFLTLPLVNFLYDNLQTLIAVKKKSVLSTTQIKITLGKCHVNAFPNINFI